jgi:hypothetical protein
MRTRSRFRYLAGVSMAVVGALLVGLALAQHVFGFTLFSSSPLLVGIAVGTIGATLASVADRTEKQAG